MGWFSRKVLVTFVDDATGATFATTKMPPGNLPESFAIETTLHLGDDDWFVVHAEPRTRGDYVKSGSLTLRLRKIEKTATEAISCSQLDVSERFDDSRSLRKEEWISTTPLNATIANPESVGLPSPNADSEEVYRVASEMSALRESIPLRDNGVYCPICHIANVNLGKLRTPCQKCGRELLKFGWT